MNLLKFLIAVLACLIAGLAGFLGFEAWRSGQLDFLTDGFLLPQKIEILEKDAAGSRNFAPVENLAPPATTTAQILAPAKRIVSNPAPLPDLTPAQVEGNGALDRAGVITETNKQRQIYLGAGHDLQENARLDIAAAAKAKDMLDGQYFEHVSPIDGGDVSDFAAAADYEYIAIGENLAKGNYKNDAILVQAWMDSPGHRENILKSGYQEIGAAVLYGTFEGQKTWLAVQIFGTPKNVCPDVDQNLGDGIEKQKAVLEQMAASQKVLAKEIEAQKAAIRNLQIEYNNLAASFAGRAALKAKLAAINAAIESVNQKVAQYNSGSQDARAVYDQNKTQIQLYNSQVAAYNACLAALE